MLIYIRADSSVAIGTGHVARCLTLANKLKAIKCKVFFICRDIEGNIASVIKDNGFEVHLLPDYVDGAAGTGSGQLGGMDITEKRGEHFWQDDAEFTQKILVENKIRPAWLIVDHYALDWRWQKFLKPYADRIMVIDDLANRSHFCDILLDQNYNRDMAARYEGLVPPSCRCLIGPKYCLLRPEFEKEKCGLKKRDGKIERILIFFGGSDPTGETLKALQALEAMNLCGIHIDVVVGKANPRRREAEEFAAKMPQTKFYCQVNNMAELMARADLAIGAAGTTSWERCYLGLPTIAIAIADNQKGAVYLEEYGALMFLGESSSVSASQIGRAVDKLMHRPALVARMSQKCFQLMEGHQADGVISHLINI